MQEVMKVDGQIMFFFSDEKWNEIVRNGQIQGAVISSYFLQRLANIELPLVRKYSELVIGVVIEKSLAFERVRTYVLLEINGLYQRIEIRGASCERCCWSGFIGTPLASDIYFGISPDVKPFELMRIAKLLPEKKCPKCKTCFRQFAIWVGVLNI